MSKAEELYNSSVYRFDLGLFAEHVLYEAEKLAERAENGLYMCEKCACETYFIYKCLMELLTLRQALEIAADNCSFDEDDEEVSNFLKGCNHGVNE